LPLSYARSAKHAAQSKLELHNTRLGHCERHIVSPAPAVGQLRALGSVKDVEPGRVPLPSGWGA
jgi:hypothetical protein